MPELNHKTLWQIQKELKPKAEVIANEIKNRDDYNNFMKFFDFLKDNKLTPRWQSVNKWSVNYKSKLICHISINLLMGSGAHDDGWRVSNNGFIKGLLVNEYDKYIINDKLKEFIWDNIKFPPCSCKPDCKGMQDIAIMGRQFGNVCRCWPISFKNPSEDRLAYSKDWIIAVKNFITDFKH